MPSVGRVDLVVDLPPTPSTTIAVVDRYYHEPVTVASIALDARAAPLDALIDLGVPTLPEPDLDDALEHEIVMRGGAMRGLDHTRLGNEWLDGRELAARGASERSAISSPPATRAL